ncbi:Fibronectin type III domain-containing protein [Paenibacillus sp. UNCCL117]|uniref:fibronectin type III domain-containing protein n=1 Tax=unclassified Paenibacillus TaxID=185978 RepID=UPI0008903B22|nr:MULTISPECIES: fibronectin type III domain-containing protein [unclassified Paenibacillus]SDE19972.1 Fibronectin type III domain-containing protein [Paenibacillus sp. cl123]SFW61890.1 Fibronectin type III domain-containing protein [Paenibacillus sp. UNCCL117]
MNNCRFIVLWLFVILLTFPTSLQAERAAPLLTNPVTDSELRSDSVGVTKQVYDPTRFTRAFEQFLPQAKPVILKELPEKRSRTTKTYLNSDRTETVVSSPYSLHYQEGSLWQEIDTHIVPDSSEAKFSHSVRKNNFKAKFNNRSNQPLQFESNNHSVSYEPEHTNQTEGIIINNSLTFVDAWDSTDLKYTTLQDSLKMELLLKAPQAPKTFSFLMNTRDVTPRLNPDGSVDFLNGNDQLEFSIPQMWVQDSSSSEYRYDRLSVNLVSNNGDIRLQFELNDTGLTYPILIDPTTTTNTHGVDPRSTTWTNKIYIDTPNIDISKITNVRFENMGGYALNGGRDVDVYLTRAEYGNLYGFGLNAPAPGSDGRSANWIGRTTAVTGGRAYVDISGDTVRSLLGPSGVVYGGAVWDDNSYVDFAWVYITYNVDDPSSASAGFSSTQGANNWSYLEWDGIAFTPMTWDAANYRWKGTSTYNLVFALGHHPDVKDSARKWTASAPGTVRITGNVRKGDTSFGDGVRVKIMKNQTQLWPSSGWHLIGFNDGVGYNVDLTTNVIAGDGIYFIVNKNVTTYADSTAWDPVISYIGANSTPAVPSNLRVGSRTSSSVTLLWDASTDSLGPVSYDILLNGSPLDVTNNTSYIFNGLTATGNYTFTVKARNSFGSVSGPSNTLVVGGDSQPPTAPGNLRIVSQTANSVTLGWTASTDNIGVTQYRVYSGPALLGTTASTSYVVSNMGANQLYSLSVRAVDAAANESQPSKTVYRYTGNYEYKYDARGRVDYIRFSSGQKLKHTYDANGNLMRVDLVP